MTVPSLKQWRVATQVVDNSSAFRMSEGVPLIIPEVNADHLNGHKAGKGGIIANPNCSTIIALMAVTPLHRAAGVKRMVVSTYQVRVSPMPALDGFKAQRPAWPRCMSWYFDVSAVSAWPFHRVLEAVWPLWQRVRCSLPLKAHARGDGCGAESLTPQSKACLQAASGAGQAAMDELEQQTREVLDGKPPTQNIFPFQVRTRPVT